MEIEQWQRKQIANHCQQLLDGISYGWNEESLVPMAQQIINSLTGTYPPHMSVGMAALYIMTLMLKETMEINSDNVQDH